MPITQHAGMYIGNNDSKRNNQKRNGALVHILDKQDDSIIDTLSSKKGEMKEPIRVSSLENRNTFDFTALKKFEYLEKLNRLLVQDSDGIFQEYIIHYAEQVNHEEKDIKANASFVGLKKAKVINPQVLTGATSSTAVDLALSSTEWQPGIIEYTFIRSITIDQHTDPYSFLKVIATTFDLEISFRIEVSGNKITGRYVDMKKQMAGFEGKEITFGKDLIGIHRIEDSSRIVTALLGLGPQKDDGTRLSVLVADEAALQRWGRNGRHLIEVYEPESDDQDMTESRLKTLTTTELKKRVDAIVSYEGEANSLEHVFGHDHEKVRVGRTMRIKDDYYSPPLYLEARFQETTENVSLRQILGFKLGNFIEFKKADLEKQIANLKNIINDKISKMITCKIETSSGTVFKNDDWEEVMVTAKVFLAGQETDFDGTRYNYCWTWKDKFGNIIGRFDQLKSFMVESPEVDEKLTIKLDVMLDDKVLATEEITFTKIYDGESGPPGRPGEDATLYWLALNSSTIAKSNMGDYTPKSITATAYSKKGTTAAATFYPGRFFIAETTDGTTYVDKYISSSNESIKTYTPSPGIKAVRVQLSTPSGSLLDEKIIPIVVDGAKGDTGPPGTPGEPGTPGSDAQSKYTWVMFANDNKGAGITSNPAGKLWRGFAYNKSDPTPSNIPSDYKWEFITDSWVKSGTVLVDSGKIFADYLSAITAHLGNIISGNIQGVTLTLGGLNNEFGQMSVLGPSGETIITLDGEQGGFDKLFVGDFFSPTVANFNEKNMTFYVDPNGSDNNDGLASGTARAKRTIQACIDLIPKFNNGIININLKAPAANTRQDYYENVIVDGFSGSGEININGQNWYNYLNSRISIKGCTNKVNVNDLTINVTSIGDAFEVYNSSHVSCVSVWVYGQNKAGTGFLSDAGSKLTLVKCEAYDVLYGIYANSLSTVYLYQCKGLGTQRGALSERGSWVYSYISHPDGTVGAVLSRYASGTTLDGSVADSGAKTGGGKPAPSAQTTTQWVSNIADNWSTAYSSWQGGGARQGDYGYGQRKGLWWFESQPFAATLNGKTIKSMRIWVKRASSGGSSGKTRIYFHPHTFATKAATPNNPSLALETTYNVYVDLAWGEGAWVNIPSTWYAGFQSGSYKGIGIWAGSTSRSYYSIMDGQCWLEATY